MFCTVMEAKKGLAMPTVQAKMLSSKPLQQYM
jgi:hypothetical protein